MDIYDWMNSKDIAEYNRQISHTFNAMESAFIVFENKSRTLAEKNEAYRWIVHNMPDMSVGRRNNCGPYDSFHQVLQEHMALTESVTAECQKSAVDAVFSYDAFCDPLKSAAKGLYGRKINPVCYGSDAKFRSWEECLTAISVELAADKDREIRCFDVTKEDIYGSSSTRRRICLTLDKELNIMGISDHRNLPISDRDFDILNLFDCIWIDLPVPFVRGDIVFENNADRGFFPEPFVLLNTANREPGKSINGRNRIERYKLSGDRIDMTADGCWIDYESPGDIFFECMHSYHNLEYYREPLEGYDRILKVIEKYYAGRKAGAEAEMYDMSHVLDAYKYIVLDEEKKRMEKNFRYELKAIGVMREDSEVIQDN